MTNLILVFLNSHGQTSAGLYLGLHSKRWFRFAVPGGTGSSGIVAASSEGFVETPVKCAFLFFFPFDCYYFFQGVVTSGLGNGKVTEKCPIQL